MTIRPLRSWLVAALAGSSLALAQSPSPQAPQLLANQQANNDMVDAIKLSEADIDATLGMLEMLTGKTIIRPAALPVTTYTLQLKKPMPRSEAILALETVLGLNGIGVTPMGDKFLKVVALAQVRTEAPELIDGSTLGLPPSGKIAAKFFQLEHGRISEVAPQLQNIVSPGIGVSIVMFERSNAALVTDTITNLQRIETLIESLDRPAATPRFFNLKFAKASELVQKIQTVMQSAALQSQFANNTTLTADDRTNQIVLVTESKKQQFFVDMIEKLDVKADPNTRTEVIYLKHATAKDVQVLLNTMITGQATAAQKAGSSQLIQRGLEGQAIQITNSQGVQMQAPTVRSFTQGVNMAPSTSFSTIITTLADERTNSIIVNGTMDDIRLIKELVDKVDIILQQVRIEAVIVEVTLTDNDTSGISTLGLNVEGNKLVGIKGEASGVSLGGSLATATDSKSGNVFSNIRSSTNRDFSLTGIISLSTTPRKSNANILQVPSITTTHNKKATFKVTTNYPTVNSYLADTTSNGSATGAYRNTVGTTEVGTTLEVTPLIGDDGSIQMEIKQEVSDKVGTSKIDNNEQPIVGKRSTDSFITAKSGEVIVLGGFQRNSTNSDTNRLGPIPFIGDLLGSRSKTRQRTDLVFFLRPVILTNTGADNIEYLTRLEKVPGDMQIKDALSIPATTQDTKGNRPPTKARGK